MATMTNLREHEFDENLFFSNIKIIELSAKIIATFDFMIYNLFSSLHFLKSRIVDCGSKELKNHNEDTDPDPRHLRQQLKLMYLYCTMIHH